MESRSAPVSQIGPLLAGAMLIARMTVPIAHLAVLTLQRADAAERITLQQAVDEAQRQAVGITLARADSVAAQGTLVDATSLENPAIALSYSKSPPQHHAAIDLPIPIGPVRSARIRAARAGLAGAGARLDLERAIARFQAESGYASAWGAGARAFLSRQNAVDAETLLAIARVRSEAGDASELDVRLAAINSGQSENRAVVDSLAGLSALMDLQRVMGRSWESVSIELADDITDPEIPTQLIGLTGDTTGAVATPAIQAAEAAVQAARAAETAERRAWIPIPTISAGVEWHDPAEPEAGALPTAGFSLLLPLWNWNRGGILRARGERLRLEAELAQARKDNVAERAGRAREWILARSRVERDRALVSDAAGVTAMSRLAYAEGEAPLANVLEAIRAAREIHSGLIDDRVAAFLAAVAWRLATAPGR